MSRHWPRMLAALCLVASLYGCAVVVVGAIAAGGTYTYITGWLKRDYPVSLDKACEGVEQAAKDLDLKIEKTQKEIAAASYDGKDAGRSFWLNIEDKGQGFVFIEVKVGYFGDESASRRIHEAIARHL